MAVGALHALSGGGQNESRPLAGVGVLPPCCGAVQALYQSAVARG
jgi:hypothetical protein